MTARAVDRLHKIVMPIHDNAVISIGVDCQRSRGSQAVAAQLSVCHQRFGGLANRRSTWSLLVSFSSRASPGCSGAGHSPYLHHLKPCVSQFNSGSNSSSTMARKLEYLEALVGEHVERHQPEIGVIIIRRLSD